MGRIEDALSRARNAAKARTAGRGEVAQLAPDPTHLAGKSTLDFSALRHVALDRRRIVANRVVSTSGSDPVARDAFKMLRTRVRRSMEAQNATTLAISSAGADEGKTLVAVNLALRMAAESGSEIILADFDLRHPSISELLGFRSSLPGLLNYLSDTASLQEACVSPGSSSLAVLTNTKVFENSSEILRSEKMADLVAEMRAGPSGRIVVFDMPPLLYADDFLAFAPHVDALLLVACEGKTKRAELAEAYDMLADDINVIGTVLNKSLGRSEAYYY